jgi:hypothetical protein
MKSSSKKAWFLGGAFALVAATIAAVAYASKSPAEAPGKGHRWLLTAPAPPVTPPNDFIQSLIVNVYPGAQVVSVTKVGVNLQVVVDLPPGSTMDPTRIDLGGGTAFSATDQGVSP